MVDYHHRSHLLDHIEGILNEINHPSIVNFLSNSVFIDTVDSKQNLSNIEETMHKIENTKNNIKYA